MKNLLKTILIAFLLLLNNGLMFSQETRVDLGDKYFDQFAYKKAIALYEGIPEGRKNWQIYANLGDCYYNTSRPEKALINYKKAFERKTFNMDGYRLKYALIRLSIDDCNNVINELITKDKTTLKVLGNYFGLKIEPDNIPVDIQLQICENKNKRKSEVELKNLDINTKNSDFGSFILDDVLYFSSSREKADEPKHNKRLYKWNEHPFLDIYEAIIIEDSDTINSMMVPIENSKIDFNTVAHEAGITIINSGKTMYFSGGEVEENNKNKLKYNKRGTSTLKLQKASLIENKWVRDDENELDVLNLKNYSVGSPAFSADNKLYFVTCAPYPEAKGQTDIYYVDLVNGKIPKNPKVHHLDKVNTKGREMYPFISKDNILYFSSDGVYPGEYNMGLLDIYSYDLNKQDKVKSLGEPYNSIKDDFAYYDRTLPDSSVYSKQGFFSSNRETFVHMGDTLEAKGDDDIYSFRAKGKCSKTIKGTIADLKTGDYLEDAIIELIDSTGMVLDTLQIDSTGLFNVKVNCNQTFSLRGSMARYDDDLQTVNMQSEAFSNTEINLKLKPYPCEIKIDPVEFRSNKYFIRPSEEEKFIPLLDLLITNPDLRIHIESHTDSIGSIIDNLKLSQNRANATKAYLIKQGVHDDRILSTIGLGENCPLYTTSYINSLATRKEREEAHNKNRRSVFILEDCEEYASDCNKNNP